MAKQTFSVGQVLSAAQMTSLQATAMGGGTPQAKTASYTLVAADAGTVIQMNSASATTITVNTSLFSAGDSVQIQNIGAGTCTITAGTATVNSAGSLAVTQYDGGFLYFSSVSSALWFDYTQAGTTSPLTTKGDLYTRTSSADARLAVGANGTTLVADSAEATGLKWATPAGSAFVGCGVTKSTTQSIANATYTAVTFNTEDYDTDAIHDNVTNNTRFTIPSGKSGKWLISGVVAFASNATGFRFVRLYKNGTAFIVPAGIPPVNGDTTQLAFSYIHTFTAGDYMEVFVYQNSGGNLNIAGSDTNVQFTYLGA